MVFDLLCLLQAFLNQHCGELVSVCEAYLAPIILSEKGAQNLNEELMVRSDPSLSFPSYPNIFFKGHLLCKIHLYMSFIHKYVSRLLRDENEPIRFCPLCDITMFLACATFSQ